MANPTMTLIASNTVGSGGVSSVTFSSIPNTYTDLLVKASVRTSYAGADDYLRFSFNGSTSNFFAKVIDGSGTAAASYSFSGAGAGQISGKAVGNGATSSTFSNSETYISNYLTANQKSYGFDGVNENNATAAYMDLGANLWADTSAITSITITTNYGPNFLQYSTFYLYGISNS